jgi:hypothetical protein
MPILKTKPVRPFIVSVEWGYALYECPMALRTWERVVAGRAVRRNEPYRYEGKRFTGRWDFNHRGKGTLLVTYDDYGVAFDGKLATAIIEIDGKEVSWAGDST